MSALEPVAPGIRRLALRTPTLPPATHTNCYVAGATRLTVFDPASPWDDEQGRLLAALDAPVERIVLTHHHVDHVSGAQALRDALAAAGRRVPVAAHPVTADLLRGEVAVDELLEDGHLLDAETVTLRCVHTPGHAPGHLVFFDPGAGTVIAGDMVAGEGTILIDPVDGHLGDYLASLARMAALGPTRLLPSHGPALDEARAVLGFYVAHRHQRTEQIRGALDAVGAATPDALVDRVYPGLPEPARPFAAAQILAHLTWMVEQGLATPAAAGRYRPAR